MATATTSRDQQVKVRTAQSKGYEVVTKFWSDQFAILVDVLGLQFRRPFTMQEFVLAVVAYSEGCSLRQQTTELTDIVVRPTGPNGRDQEWTLFAVGLEGLVHQFLEPGPAKAS